MEACDLSPELRVRVASHQGPCTWLLRRCLSRRSLDTASWLVVRSRGSMDFRILGPLEVYAGDAVVPLGGAKQRGLLAMLLLHAGEVVSNDRLIDALWGEQPPDTALKALQVHVSQ